MNNFGYMHKVRKVKLLASFLFDLFTVTASLKGTVMFSDKLYTLKNYIYRNNIDKMIIIIHIKVNV